LNYYPKLRGDTTPPNTKTAAYTTRKQFFLTFADTPTTQQTTTNHLTKHLTDTPTSSQQGVYFYSIQRNDVDNQTQHHAVDRYTMNPSQPSDHEEEELIIRDHCGPTVQSSTLSSRTFAMDKNTSEQNGDETNNIEKGEENSIKAVQFPLNQI